MSSVHWARLCRKVTVTTNFDINSTTECSQLEDFIEDNPANNSIEACAYQLARQTVAENTLWHERNQHELDEWLRERIPDDYQNHPVSEGPVGNIVPVIMIVIMQT